MTQEEQILEIFKDSKALLEGHFILRSGLRSGHFFQCAKVCQYMDKVTKLVAMLIEKLPNTDFDTVLSPAIGGLVVGQEFARQTGKRFIFAEKENDKLVLRRDFKMAKDEKIFVVEDVITRGGRVDEALAIIESWGALPVGVAVLVDRSQGKTKFKVPHTSLLEMSFPTYTEDNLPESLQAIPVVKHGS